MPFLFIELWYLWDFGPSPAKLVLFDIRHTKFPNRRVKKFLFVFCLKNGSFHNFKIYLCLFPVQVANITFLLAFLKEKGFIESDVISNNSQSRLNIVCIDRSDHLDQSKSLFPGKIMFSLKSSFPHIFWWDVLGKYSPVFSLVANMVVPLYSMTKEIVSSDLAAVLYVTTYILNIWYFFKSAFPASQNVACQGWVCSRPCLSCPSTSPTTSPHPTPTSSKPHINLSPL